MSILVTGGSGFLGSRLVRKLEKSGKVIIFERKKDEAGKGSPNVRIIHGDLKNKEDLEEAFRKKDVEIVYHLAANLDECSPTMYDDNVNGTRNIVELSRKYNVKRFIFMGSCGVTGYGKISREDSPYSPNTLYEKSKADSEEIVVDSGIPYTVIRAPIIIGPNDIWLKIAKTAKKGFPIIGSGENHFHLAYVDDVVDLLFLARNRKNAENGIFNVAASDYFTYKEVYNILSAEAGGGAAKSHVPASAMKTVAGFYELFCKIAGKKPKVTMMKSSIIRLVVERVVSIEKAKEELGFEPKYDTKRAIKETVHEFKRKGLL